MWHVQWFISHTDVPLELQIFTITIITTWLRYDNVRTTSRRCIDVMATLLSHHVSVGYQKRQQVPIWEYIRFAQLVLVVGPVPLDSFVFLPFLLTFPVRKFYLLNDGENGFLVVVDYVITWKRFPRRWSFIRGIHRLHMPRHEGSVTRSFDIFFVGRLNKLLHKQSICRRFDTVWRPCNVTVMHSPPWIDTIVDQIFIPKWQLHAGK